MPQSQNKNQGPATEPLVNGDKLAVKPETSPPEITITPGHRLAVPQPGTNVQDVRPDPRDVQTSQSQETAHIQVVQSIVETQINDWNPTNENMNPISMVNPIYGNVPTSRPRIPE